MRDFEREWLTSEVKAHIRSLISSSILAQSQAEASGTTLLERRLAGERYMRGLDQAWQDYQLGINMLSDVLMYMVSHQLIRELVFKSPNAKLNRTACIVKTTGNPPFSSQPWDSSVIMFFVRA